MLFMVNKKYFCLVSLLISIVCIQVFAQVPVFLSGETRLEWGVNFNNNANGFKNKAEIDIEFPLVPLKSLEYGTSVKDLKPNTSVNDEVLPFDEVVKNNETSEFNKTTKDNLYKKSKPSRRAEISIKDFEWVYRFESLNGGTPVEDSADISDDDTDKGHTFKIGEVTAKLFLDSVYIDIYGNTDFSTNFAKKPSPLNDDNETWDDVDWKGERLIVGSVSGNIAGATKIGYFNNDIGINDLSLKFASTTNFDDNSASNVISDYFAGLDFNFETALQKVEIAGAVQVGSFRQKNIWVGFGFSTQYKPFPEFLLYAGFDGTCGTGSAVGVTYFNDSGYTIYPWADFACDAELSCSYNFFDVSLYGLGIVFSEIKYEDPETGNTKKKNLDNYYDLGFKIGFNDGGFVDSLNASVALVCDQLLNSPNLDSNKRFNSSIEVVFDYKWFFNNINYIKPYTKAAFSFKNKETYVKAGLEYGLLHLATIYVYYQQGIIADLDDYGSYVVSSTSSKGSPKLVFGVKIEF